MQSVFVPDEVRLSGVDIVLFHAGLKQGDDVTVVRVLSEGQSSAVVHEFGKLVWLVLTELFDLDFLLLFLDVSVRLGLGSSWEALPWERAFQEIQKHVANCLEIISSRLFVSNMGVDTGVSSCSCQIFTISEWNVLSI